jgi:hypothetical protein
MEDNAISIPDIYAGQCGLRVVVNVVVPAPPGVVGVLYPVRDTVCSREENLTSDALQGCHAHVRTYFLVYTVVCATQPLEVFAWPTSPASRLNVQQPLKERDGQRDFDFKIGTWKTHLSRLQHPLSGSTSWVEYEGYFSGQKRLGWARQSGRPQSGWPSRRIEGLSLRLYNPESHRWNLNFADTSSGTLGQPTIGEFKNGRGEFYDQEPLNGRTILVRSVFSDITPTSCRFEQAFSDDGARHGRSTGLPRMHGERRIEERG